MAFDDPKDIHQLNTLKIESNTPSHLPHRIHANSRNQMQIQITAKLPNKDNKVMHFDNDTWMNKFVIRGNSKQKNITIEFMQKSDAFAINSLFITNLTN